MQKVLAKNMSVKKIIYGTTLWGRNVSLDLLRVITMLMIIMSHCIMMFGSEIMQ